MHGRNPTVPVKINPPTKKKKEKKISPLTEGSPKYLKKKKILSAQLLLNAQLKPLR